MSKRGFYLADADNYIMRQIVAYLSEKLEEDVSIRVSYREEDKKEKSGKISKVLNKTKPKLFRSYLLKSDVLIVDLILNPEADKDVDLICQAVEKAKELDKDIKVVILSSYQSWHHTDVRKYYEQFKKEPKPLPPKVRDEDISSENGEGDGLEIQQEVDANKINEADLGGDIEQASEKEFYDQKTEKGTQNEIVDDEQEPDKQIDYVTLRPEYFDFRVPHQNFENSKALEDRLDKLLYVSERVTLYYLYVGLVYGQEEFFLSHAFENAWRQKPIAVHTDLSVRQYQIPLYDVNQIAPTILHLVDTDSYVDEYVGACKELLQSIRPPSEPADDVQDPENPKSDEVPVDIDELEPEEPKIKGRRLVVFLDESKTYDQNTILKLISTNLGNSKLHDSPSIDPIILTQNYKIAKNEKLLEFYEQLTSGFETRIKHIIREYLLYFNLKAIKIFSHSTNTMEKLLRKLANTYNLNIVDLLTLDQDLKAFEPFSSKIPYFSPVEAKCLTNYSNLIVKTNLPSDQKAALQAFIKFRLSMNDSCYNGYVLVNTFAVKNICTLDNLFYVNNLSHPKYIQNIDKRYRKQVREQEKAQQARLQELKRLQKEKARKHKIEEKRERLKEELRKLKMISEANKEDTSSDDQDDQQNDENSNDDQFDEQEIELTDEEVEEEEPEQEDDPEEQEEEEQAEEEIESRRKKERFFPDHFILANQDSETDELAPEVTDFTTLKGYDIFSKFIDPSEASDPAFEDELFHDILIYIDRKPRPYNFLPPMSDIRKKYTDQFIMTRTAESNLAQVGFEMQAKMAEKYFEGLINENNKKFLKLAVDETSEKIIQTEAYKNTRKFITDCFYEALNGGLLEVKKLKPEDPFEFLADHVFEYSNKLN